MISRVIVSMLLSSLAFSAMAACDKKNPPSVDLYDYYSKASGKTGDSLKSALNNIIKDHKGFSYTPRVWEILKDADEDRTNSNNVIVLFTGRPFPKARQDRGTNDPVTV